MDNDLAMDPGPRDPSVLHMQSIHRSTTVWKAGGGDSQRGRRRNPNRNRFPPLHPRMIPILTALRFDGVARLTGIDIDWGLITALVERWRPETHTFHLPIGECMITLQDVSVLLGLRIDGHVVTGATEFEGGWDTLIQNIFGEPPGSSLNGGRLQLTWLASLFPSLPDDASDEHLIQYIQLYLLQLFAGILFTDHSGGLVHCMYIPLVQDLDRCSTLSWGSAVLAFLFRELCKSCRSDTEEIAGCILLLQLWAWTRMPTLAPVCRRPSLPNPDIWGDLPGPYGLRWCAHLSFTDIGAHVVSTYRVSLDVLAPSHFIWQPYTIDVLEKLSDHCTESSIIWRYKGSLICFHIVEPHLPDRCLRQFGMIQDVPSIAVYSNDLHSLNLKGKTDKNWRIKHMDHIEHWNSRVEHVFDGDVGTGVSDGYEHWYSEITRRFLTRVGGAHLYMLELLEHIALIAMGQRDGDVLFAATQGRKFLEQQFSPGVFQNFPIEARRAKEVELKGKAKRVGHKGGRGGVNAPRRLNVEKRGDHVVDDSVHVGDDDIQPPPHVGEILDHIEEAQPGHHEVEAEAEEDPTPPLSHPTFKLISSSDSASSHLLEHTVIQTELHPTPSLSPPPDHAEVDAALLPPLGHAEPPLLPVCERMQLRPRNHEGQKCGTGGHKVIQPYKRRRLVKKYKN